ncbi:hypothetical protein FSP39_023316 [Pinctada imbricata]|uniref:Uncharacterized protein n=1 Tax=Pinctada imbricata TaxID=66713 RepID=A0AA89CBK5_PINIB|nr:hypothetical protein FSP39_023316 [Pinctada imbricata]
MLGTSISVSLFNDIMFLCDGIGCIVCFQGQVQLAEMANISQTDILTNNGLIHRIDGLLIPKCIEQTLLSRCDYAVTTRVRGFCYYCEHLSKETPICKKGDAPTVQQKCCAGYYGPDCLPCPRKFDSPCSGNGKCYDGVNGTGTCQCDVGFHGDICDQIDNHV